MTEIPRGKYIGRRIGEPPVDEAEHFINCETCGGWIDCRDLGRCSAMKGVRPASRGSKVWANGRTKTPFKVALYKEGNGPMEICAAIRHEGEIWLVPDWIRSPRGRSAKPLRMIPLSKYPHKEFPQTSEAFADYGINGLVPTALFDLHISAKLSATFGVRERPDLAIQMGRLQLTR
jgi:hypothetical protein